MWYGYLQKPRLSLTLRSHKRSHNKRQHVFGERLSKRDSYPKLVSTLYVPNPWKLLVLKSQTAQSLKYSLYLYESNYFYNTLTPLGIQSLWFDSTTNVITIRHAMRPYCYSLVLKSLQSTLTLFNKPFFLKLRFRGKGYYMYKNSRQTIAPQFGYAHRVYVYSQANSVKFLSKTKILLFGLSRTEITKTAYNLVSTKPVNIFTGRGVRFARQIVYRKVGKVSSYR